MINIPKGTKDVLPKDSYKWQFIEKKARTISERFNVKEIRTPTFEHTEVFLRGVGETTDIVNKEMYTFLDKGDRSITLKPEGTAGVARAFIENGLNNEALPAKLYYITPCFRYERPQAGRLREFHQYGVEFLGSDKPDIDAEVIILAKSYLDALGIKDVVLYINSIGCKECRKEYHKALTEYFNSRKSELCELCNERLDKNPMRVLDCKNSDCKHITQNAPSILDYICPDCKKHFERVQELLKASKIDFEIDSRIVRGLDYYTKTVFEFVSTNIGAQGTVCGGGRYDGLIKQLGGADVPGIGFAMGIERLMLVMENTGVKIRKENRVKVYFAPMGDECYKKCFELASVLRKKGVKCDIDHMDRSIKAQFKYADKIQAKYVAILGQNELDMGEIKIKNMENGGERFIRLSEVEYFFTKQDKR